MHTIFWFYNNIVYYGVIVIFHSLIKALFSLPVQLYNPGYEPVCVRRDLNWFLSASLDGSISQIASFPARTAAGTPSQKKVAKIILILPWYQIYIYIRVKIEWVDVWFADTGNSIVK